MWDKFIKQNQKQSSIKMTRIWEMPNKWTFKMRCVQNLLSDYVDGDWADPFAGLYSPAKYRNDIEENRNSTHTMDALDFLKSFDDNSLDGDVTVENMSETDMVELYGEIPSEY